MDTQNLKFPSKPVQLKINWIINLIDPYQNRNKDKLIINNIILLSFHL